jgi:hypothetical protein
LTGVGAIAAFRSRHPVNLSIDLVQLREAVRRRYITSSLMSTIASLVRRLFAVGIVVLAAALVLVPTAARARQHVDRQDTTRLSIKHSWLGVAPPTKASVAPTSVALVPAPAVRIECSLSVSRVSLVRSVAPRSVRHCSPDLLRGPPSYLA